MSALFRGYKNLLRKFPLGMQAVQAGILMGFGDQLAQNVVERRKFEDLDFIRTAQFASIGFFIGGPVTKTWYGMLDKRFGSKGGTVALKKVACDQVFFAPTFMAVLLGAISAFQGGNIEHIKEKFKNEYFDIITNNYKLWPMVQLVNFSFVPLQYQVLVVQSVAVLWNTYISYRTNRDEHQVQHKII